MPVYFFDIDDGSVTLDVSGTELASLDEAQQAAARFAGEVIRDHPREFWSSRSWRLSVRDQDGEVLFILSVAASVPQNMAA